MPQNIMFISGLASVILGLASLGAATHVGRGEKGERRVNIMVAAGLIYSDAGVGEHRSGRRDCTGHFTA